jgi:hypothetical protein
MQPLSTQSRILAEWNGKTEVFHLAGGAGVIDAFNQLIERADPDLILSERGNTVLFPALLSLAERTRSELRLDRGRWSWPGSPKCRRNGPRGLYGIKRLSRTERIPSPNGTFYISLAYREE